jgi:beta-glucosidase
MRNDRRRLAIWILTALAVAPALESLDARSPDRTQPTIDARGASVLKLGQLTFKDLNHNGALDPYEDWRLPVEKRVSDLVSKMSLVEKAGLMQITSFNAGALDDYINKRHIRYVILRDNLNARETAARANAAQQNAEASRLGIPLVFTSNPRNHAGNNEVYEQAPGSDGAFSIWPGSLGLAATNDLTLIRDFARMIRAEWRAAGIRKMYGYQIDVATEPRWYRIQTTFGESPKLNADIARELVLGLQGRRLGPESVALTIKHFPGDGAVDRGLDPHNAWGQWAVYPTPGSFFKYQLPPFQAAVDAGTSSIMSFYNVPSNAKSGHQFPSAWWPGDRQQFEEVAGAYNPAILDQLLRRRMGFKGYVNTDSGVLGANAFGVENLTLSQRFAKGVRAGVAIFSDNSNPQGLIDAVNQHLLEEAELNGPVTLLLTEVFQLGLFENPYTDPETALAIANSEATAARAREAHRKSIVLLRNDRKTLPIADRTRIYAEVLAQPAAGGGGGFGGRGPAGNPGVAFDPNAVAGRGEGNPGRGAERGAGRGGPQADPSAAGTASLKALLAKDASVQIVDSLEQADVALLWLRPSVNQRAEHDYADIVLGPLTGIDVAKVKRIEAAKPTVLAINMTVPWVINDVEPGAAAVVATFDVKAQALLDVIRGRFRPAGKLPLTIPADQVAVEKNAPDVPGYAESFDYAYTSRANDKYIFGFGLTYGK